MTKQDIKDQAKAMFAELKDLYERLDNLMDDAQTEADGCTEEEGVIQSEFQSISNLIELARDHAQEAYDDLESVQNI